MFANYFRRGKSGFPGYCSLFWIEAKRIETSYKIKLSSEEIEQKSKCLNTLFFVA